MPLIDALMSTRRIYAAGQGRSGLAAAAFAVRLGHLGLEVHVAGEATCPPIGDGDLLVAVSASGRTAITLHQLDRARAAGAAVAAISATAVSPLMQRATLSVHLPVGAIGSSQHAGSLFEQAVLVFGDAVSKLLQRELALEDAQMAARHDNLQ
jgi:6-phospho-3-hexuloisomerase